MDKFVVKTPWGKLVQLKGLEHLLESFMKDIENQNLTIKKLQEEIKTLKHLEMAVAETKDMSILTRRAIKRLISKFDDEEKYKGKTDLIENEFPDMKQSVEQFELDINTVKETQDRISSEVKLIAERQEKHAKRIDTIFESLISLMDKIDRIQSKSSDSPSLDKVLESAIEQNIDDTK